MSGAYRRVIPPPPVIPNLVLDVIPIDFEELQKDWFARKTSTLVILNAVKDLSKTQHWKHTGRSTINDRFFAFGSE